MSETTTTPRRVYRTAQIKPRTRDALMDVLAGAADEVIRLREAIEDRKYVAEAYREAAVTALAELREERSRSLWRRLQRWLVRCWPP